MGSGRQHAPVASLWRMACCLLSALREATACAGGGVSQLIEVERGCCSCTGKRSFSKQKRLCTEAVLSKLSPTCRHSTRRSPHSATGATPAATATSDRAWAYSCSCCSCCCFVPSDDSLTFSLSSVPPIPFLNMPLNALRLGDSALRSSASPACADLLRVRRSGGEGPRSPLPLPFLLQHSD